MTQSEVATFDPDDIVVFSYGETPDKLVKELANKQCPDGYPMQINSQDEWSTIASAVNKGIDGHLEALTSRSTFDAGTGKCLVHPDELHVLLRRLLDGMTPEEADPYRERPSRAEHLYEVSTSLRMDILTTLGVEEV